MNIRIRNEYIKKKNDFVNKAESYKYVFENSINLIKTSTQKWTKGDTYIKLEIKGSIKKSNILKFISKCFAD